MALGCQTKRCFTAKCAQKTESEASYKDGEENSVV